MYYYVVVNGDVLAVWPTLIEAERQAERLRRMLPKAVVEAMAEVNADEDVDVCQVRP